MELQINNDLKKLIPPLSAEEFSQLERNIIEDGCRDPLVVWGNTIVDGHNRYSICTENNIDFSTVQMEFDDESAVKEWMILNQFGRRNLPNFVRAELALKLKPLIAEKAEKNLHLSGGKGCQNSDKVNPVDTKKELAEKAGVSHDTIARTEKILELADDETKGKLRLGDISINQAYKEITTPANYSSESENWYTPDRYMDTVRNFFNGIDLDPCSCEQANQTVNAERIFTKEDDSLTKKWFGKVFMNPPYGKDGIESVAGKFCDKAIEEYMNGNVEEVIILVNSSHTQKWQSQLYNHTVCFVDHRIKFVASDGSENNNPTFGNIFVYLGSRVKVFAECFSQHGYVMELVK